jgi:uncharacterized protein with GYD domain
MAHYLLQVAYTPEAWSSMIKKGGNRLDAVKPFIEEMGGSLVGGWLCFGEYDLIAIIQMPDNATAAGFSLAAAAGGAVRMLKTTPLLSTEEGVQALKKAKESSYRPPS